MTKLFQLLENIHTILSSQAAQNKHVLTLPEAALYLGISKQKLYQLTSERKISHSKPCERIFFDRRVLDAWALSNPIRTVDEISTEAKKKVG